MGKFRAEKSVKSYQKSTTVAKKSRNIVVSHEKRSTISI